MKSLLLSLAVCAALLAGAEPAAAQFTESRLPFYYAVHGGLFFPSRENFRETYGSASDLVWGFGVAFPITNDFLYMVTDIAWFSSEGLLDAQADSTVRLEERFIHLGLLDKVFISQRDAVRIQAGLSYAQIKEAVTGPVSGELSAELPRKLGYFGGVGLEHIPAGGGLAFYADLLYEYRRSRERSLPGDFGGVRLELGVNVNFN
jgi:hypothetical protein